MVKVPGNLCWEGGRGRWYQSSGTGLGSLNHSHRWCFLEVQMTVVAYINAVLEATSHDTPRHEEIHTAYRLTPKQQVACAMECPDRAIRQNYAKRYVRDKPAPCRRSATGHHLCQLEQCNKYAYVERIPTTSNNWNNVNKILPTWNESQWQAILEQCQIIFCLHGTNPNDRQWQQENGALTTGNS